jgi:hypothetical protein
VSTAIARTTPGATPCVASTPTPEGVARCILPMLHAGDHDAGSATWPQLADLPEPVPCDRPACVRAGWCGCVPDIDDPRWPGNTKALEGIFVAPPNARRVG